VRLGNVRWKLSESIQEFNIYEKNYLFFNCVITTEHIITCADLLSGIWYWNRLNLKFDSGEFNNILTPLLTLIATPIYAFALYTTIKQNKIAHRQNLKPFYEKKLTI